MEECQRIIKEAATRAAKPSADRLAENAKCDKGCQCFAVGQPEWEIDDKGRPNWHAATLSRIWKVKEEQYTIKADADALDGIQGGVCRGPDKTDYELPPASEQDNSSDEMDDTDG